MCKRSSNSTTKQRYTPMPHTMPHTLCHTHYATHTMPHTLRHTLCHTLCHTHYATHTMPHYATHTMPHYATHTMSHTLCHTHYATLCHTHYATHTMPHTLCHTHCATHTVPHTLCHTHNATHYATPSRRNVEHEGDKVNETMQLEQCKWNNVSVERCGAQGTPYLSDRGQLHCGPVLVAPPVQQQFPVYCAVLCVQDVHAAVNGTDACLCSHYGFFAAQVHLQVIHSCVHNKCVCVCVFVCECVFVYVNVCLCVYVRM